ncbi:MAG TPA: hypothetical protein ENI23_00090 [bacterium]|nr:hypothetical protein [bacterium]
MHIGVTPSKKCSKNLIRVPKKIRENLGLDCGDWLVFETAEGKSSFRVEKAFLSDIEQFGDEKSFVSEGSLILKESGEVYIKHHNLTIGCDPEFFLVNKKTRNVLNAEVFFKREDQVGSDGPLGELRPDYSDTPQGLVTNLSNLILSLNSFLPKDVCPLALSYNKGLCSGFHVHLGFPIEILSFAADDTHKFINNIVYTLDYLVGIPTLFIDLDDRRRFSKEYGNPGDYRLNMRTLEYRTPGGYHLASPSLTQELLSLSFSVVSSIIKTSEELTRNWTNMKPVLDFSSFRERYNLPDKKSIRSIFYSDRNEISKEREKAINVLEAIKTINGEPLRYSPEQTQNPEILENWLNAKTHCLRYHEKES